MVFKFATQEEPREESSSCGERGSWKWDWGPSLISETWPEFYKGSSAKLKIWGKSGDNPEIKWWVKGESTWEQFFLRSLMWGRHYPIHTEKIDSFGPPWIHITEKRMFNLMEVLCPYRGSSMNPVQGKWPSFSLGGTEKIPDSTEGNWFFLHRFKYVLEVIFWGLKWRGLYWHLKFATWIMLTFETCVKCQCFLK